MRETLLAPPARGWIFPFALLAYGLIATRDWRVPDASGFPLVPLWGALVILGIGGWVAVRRRLSAEAAMAILCLSAMFLNDVTTLVSQVLRDLHLYLKAGSHFLAGGPVYLQQVLAVRPDDLSNYPFLYPPLTLPVFGALSLVPSPLIDICWFGASLALALYAMRALGLSWRWAFALLLWPPFVQGLWVGNVAVPLLALFVLAPRFGAGLMLSPVFKLYSGVTTLWLPREGRWRDVALGGAIVIGLAIVTLPLVGLARWSEWIEGLRLFQASQVLLPAFLYGQSLPRYIPWLVALGLGVLAIVIALRSRGLVGLERLGLATIVVSPSLYAHGLLVGLPAFLRLRPGWMWLALGLTGIAPAAPSWIGIGIVAAAWFVPQMRRAAKEPVGGPRPETWDLGLDPLDPLDGSSAADAPRPIPGPQAEPGPPEPSDVPPLPASAESQPAPR